jgi:hypothetical protein
VDSGNVNPSTAAMAVATTDSNLVARGEREVVEIEKYYQRAGANAGRIAYFQGMVLGAIVLTAITAAIAAALWAVGIVDFQAPGTHTFLASYAAGALGAVVSVMSRIRARTFTLDYEVGRNYLRFLGTVRPGLGALFGLALYFALKGGLLQLTAPPAEEPLYFFTFLAFLAGFSERWTHVILGGAEATVAPTLAKTSDASSTGGTTTSTGADPGGETREGAPSERE